MKLEITSKKEDKLFGRQEIDFKIEDIEKTPSRREVITLLTSKINEKEDQIALRNIKTFFGSNSVKGKAFVYKSRDMLIKIEQKFIVKRDSKKKKGEEASAEPAAPVEEKKEAAK